MDTVCALCNGMITLSPQCVCGGEMRDSGPVHDYSGPYSPYYNTGFEDSHCRHLFTCLQCGRDRTIIVPLIEK